MSDTDSRNEDEPEDGARPLTGEPAGPSAMRLRPEPPRVTRLSRKVLAGIGLVASVSIGGALVYALQTRDGGRPAEELYNIALDPECLHNLAKDAQYAQTKQELRKRLDAALVQEKDPRALGNGAIFDTYKYQGGEAKSYDYIMKLKAEGIDPATVKKKKKKPAADQ